MVPLIMCQVLMRELFYQEEANDAHDDHEASLVLHVFMRVLFSSLLISLS